MPFHFLSHPWDVQNVREGLRVAISQRDLNAQSLPGLVDDLFELLMESGQPNLYLDFAEVHALASVVIGKLLALDARLRKAGCRLILQSLDRANYELLEAARVNESLDVREASYQTA